MLSPILKKEQVHCISFIFQFNMPNLSSINPVISTEKFVSKFEKEYYLSYAKLHNTMQNTFARKKLAFFGRFLAFARGSDDCGVGCRTKGVGSSEGGG
jgi:hypothetical protein